MQFAIFALQNQPLIIEKVYFDFNVPIASYCFDPNYAGVR